MAKSKSRRQRLSDALGKLRDELSEVESLIPDESELNTSDDPDEETKLSEEHEKLLGELNDRISALDLSTVEELRDEIQSWRENIEEKLSHTSKYERLQECEDLLTGEIDNVQGVYEASDFEELRNNIDEINGYLDEMENADFPSMFG